MENNSLITPRVEEVAKSEAVIWKINPYYDNAEKWTWLFWDESRPFRRLFNQLDLTSVLELACGYGRHAEYLLEHFHDKISHLTMMDIVSSNIEHCRTRIGKRDDVSFIVNGGADFQPVAELSLTAIYCYDAMVHFNRQVVQSYLRDCFRVLQPGGRALFHHSNYQLDTNQHFYMNPHGRAFMPAGLFKQYAEDAGLKVCEQVVIPWGNVDKDLDCISLVEKIG